MVETKTKTKAVNDIAQEIQKELTEEYQIDLTGVDIGTLTSMISENKIMRFDDEEYPSMADILPKLTSKTDSNSFAIVDIGAVFRQYRLWRKNLPNVEIFYAVKCNPDPMILKTLASLGAGFDVASKGEIALVTDLVDPNRDKIIYANPCKGLDHMKFARSRQIYMMTFDNSDELLKIALLHPDAKLVLRILVDNKDHQKSKMPFGSKFGCPMADIRNVLERAKYLELDVIGVSFHVGSGCFDASAYSDALKQAKIVFNTAKELGFNFYLIDIGGGFPGHVESGEVPFEDMAAEINRELTESFSDIVGLRVIAEPGRFFATSAMTIVTSVTGKKRIYQKNENGYDNGYDNESNKRIKLDYDDLNNDRNGNRIFHYYINSSLYGMFNSKIFDKADPKFKLLNKYNNPTTYKSVIFGETCDSLDKIAEGIDIPELAIGDYLYVENHGAYTLASASAFNGFNLPDVIYIFTY